MHRHGVGFTAACDGTELYETTTWSEPAPRDFDPAYVLSANQQITFACTYHNDTGASIHYGISAATNEMCVFSTLVYPVPSLPDGSFACY
jgi:hypothetical protein